VEQQTEEDIQILTNLGLTIVQARTYLALAKLGTATIKTISKSANIARQNMYNVMPALQQKGLIEKVITTPTMYKATPMQEGLEILLREKTSEYTKLQSSTKKLLSKFHDNSAHSVEDEEAQFIVSSEVGLALKRLEGQIYNAKKRIDTVSTWKYCGGMINNYSDEIEKAMSKGVKFRALTDNRKYGRKANFLQKLQKNPLFEIRYTTLPIQLKMTITDDEEVNLCISTAINRGLPNMWSNNPNLAKIAVSCFEEMWKEAKP
jgi:sugar-specific transcriptional regulator TrmB